MVSGGGTAGGLYQKELVAVDGSKFRAVNSSANCYKAETLEKKLKHIAEYLKQMDTTDEAERQESQPTAEQVQQALEDLR